MSTVRHNEKDGRFESDADGGVAYVEYIIDGDEITFTHTEVPKQAQGKGIAGRLVAEAMAYARGANLRAARAAYVTRVMVVAVVTPGAPSGIALAHAARRMPQGSSIR